MDVSMSQFLLLGCRVAGNSLLVVLCWVEPCCIKGSLQTAKYLGTPPLA